ncbi:MAG: hypothetical protein KY455_08925 [Euryarchaeota archaeon]|nr:hypothetical protein [Euryarchaeota archaeon]
MYRPPQTLAQANTVDTAKDFFINIFTGVQDGDIFSLIVVGIGIWILARLLFARWVFTIVNNTMIAGGLGYAVWWGAKWLETEKGMTTASQVLLIGGGLLVFFLYFAMIYTAILRHQREKNVPDKPAKAKGKVAVTGANPSTAFGRKTTVRPGATTTRIGAGPLQHQNIPIHQTKEPATVEFEETGQAPGGAKPTAAGAEPLHETNRLEDVLGKMNILGKSSDQNIMTVMVLILVAEFGVFTGKTIAAPTAQTGMFLAAIFAVGAIVFVKTSYKDYWRGVRHFVFATLFAVGLSLVMLVYWQTWCDPGVAAAAAECVEMTGNSRWSTVLNPNYYFASDGLIAAISAVAFSTLLTKGGG